MILDRALVAPGDEDEVLDAGVARLVDHVLDQRPVDHGQHFLRDRLARRQKAGAEARDGKHGLADGSSHSGPLMRLSPESGGWPPSFRQQAANCNSGFSGFSG